MKYRHRISSSLVLLLTLLLLLAGCAPAPHAAASPAAEPSAATESPAKVEPAAVSVTDMKGNTITLDKPAERVVALAAGDCEILAAVGAEHTLVGRGEYCDYPESVQSVPSVVSGAEMNTEQILALDPDLVVMNVMDQTVEQFSALQDAGVAVAATDANTIDEVYENIRLVGALVGKTTEAEAVIADMQETFSSVSTRAANAGKTVYFEVSPLAYGLWTAGTNTFMDEIATMLHLENAFADISGWAEISEEQVLGRDPDYIVTIAMYFGEGPTPTEEIISRPGWETLSAVQNGCVFSVDSNAIARPGPRLADAAEALSALITESATADKAA